MSPSLSLGSILPHIPTDIVDALETEFTQLSSRFARSDWAPAERDGSPRSVSPPR